MSRSLPIEALEARAYLTIAFAAPQAFTVEANNTGVLQRPIAADFNKDGTLDLLVVDATSDSNTAGKLQFAAGNGNGTYTVGTAFSGGIFNGEGKAGDLNGDGNLDVILPNGFGNNVVVLLGNGNGTFGAPTSFTVGQEPLSVAVADFNKDGFADIAVGNRTDNTVTIRLGSNSGILQATSAISGFNDPASIVAADFNGDTNIDLIVGSAGGTDGQLSFLAGNGSGGFAAAVNTTGPRAATGSGDFNGDGRIDLAISVADSGGATVALGNGDGTFQVSSVPTGGFIALVADYDGDGKADIASAGTSDNKLRVLPGRGNGTFDSFVSFNADAPGAGTVADINADGKPDLVLTGLTSNGRVIDTLINNSTTGGTNTGPLDLTATLTAKVPTSAVGGQTRGSAKVKITNAGPGLLSQPVTVTIFASPDGTVTNGTALTSVTKTLKVKANRSKSVGLKFTYGASLPEGSYTLVAQVDSANTVAESNEGNNIAASTTQVAVAPPFVDLSGTFPNALPLTAGIGTRQSIIVNVTNNGNVPAKGPLQITLNSTTNADGSGGTNLATLNKNINFKPGKSGRLKFAFTIPSTAATGTFFIAAVIDSAGAFAEKNETNNVVVSSTQVTIS